MSGTLTNKDGKKRGAPTTEELNFIRENSHQNDEWIANKLTRTERFIKRQRHILTIRKAGQEQQDETDLIRFELHRRFYWPELTANYTPEELKQVENHWVKMVGQFGSDITHTEEMQILKVINLEILLNRVQIDRTNIIKNIDMIQKMIDEMEEVDTSELGDSDRIQHMATLQNLTNQLQVIRSAQSFKSKEYNETLDKYQQFMKMLKATRDQRFKEIENRGTSFFSWMKALDDKTLREKEGRKMELFRKSMELEENRLSQSHTYSNNEDDLPLLNADTVSGDIILESEIDEEDL